MKERRDPAMIKETTKNKDVNGTAVAIKEEVKEEVRVPSGCNTPDTKPLSSMANGEAGCTGRTKGSKKSKKNTPKSEDSNKNKIISEGLIKEENGGPHSVGSDNKKSPAGLSSLPMAPGVGAAAQTTPAANFSQQQSTVFVFSTSLANSAAESVKQGLHRTIIDYHLSCPSTQQSLAQLRLHQGKMMSGGPTPGYHNYSHKMGGPPIPGMGSGGPNDLAPGMLGPSSGPGGPGSMPMGGGSGMPDVASWVSQQNAQMEHCRGGMPNYPGSSPGMGPNGPGSGMYSHGMMGGPGGGSMGPGPGAGFSMMDSYDFNIDNVGGGTVTIPHMSLSQNKVPDENLTLEQVRHRSDKLGQLNKMKGQLMEAGYINPEPDTQPMFNLSGGMTAQQTLISGQQTMMAQQQAMLAGGPGPGGGPGGGPPHHPGMVPHSPYMMQQQHMRIEGQFPPGHPANFRGPGHSMHQMQAQSEWMRMTSEYYMEKKMSQHGSMMGGPMGPHGPMNGPPPPYYSTITGSSKRMQGPMMMGSPPSPGPMGPTGPMMDDLIFPGPRGRPGMPMDPTMDGLGPGYGPAGMPPHGMGAMGMMHSMEGPMMGPSMGPGMSPQGPMGPASMMGPGGPRMPGSMSGSSVNMPSTGGRSKGSLGPQVTLHRAGNPEQFTPETSVMPGATASKPPPPYGQSQKRKRAAQTAVDDLDDPYKNLQPTPSPTQLSYLHQFEGQELTITKQLNTAYRENTTTSTSTGTSVSSCTSGTGTGGGNLTPHHEPNTSVPPAASGRQQQQQLTNAPFSSPASNSAVHSPMTHNNSSTSNATTNPPSVKNPMSNSSQTSSTGHLGSPANTTQGQHPGSVGPGPSPISGANVRLSHYDPPTNNSSNAAAGPGSSATTGSGGMSSAPATPTAVGAKQQSGMSSTISHLTSHTLEAMSKHVETITSNLMPNQGGPYHLVQMQSQASSNGGGSSSGSSGNSSTSSTGSQGPPMMGQQQQQPAPGARVPHPQQLQDPVSNPAAQYINNTNISQVNNYYNVSKDNAHSSMDVHGMSVDRPSVSMASGVGMMGPGMSMNGAGMVGPTRDVQPPSHMQQHASMMMQSGPGGMGVSMAMAQAQGLGPGGPQAGPGMVPTAPMPGQHQGMSPSMKSPPYSMPSQHHPGSLPHPSMSSGMHQGGMGTSRLTSPSYPSSSVGNASVHIQAKAPNTIQYLPANPPPSQQPTNSMPLSGVGGPTPAKRAASEMEMMARYGSPMDLKATNPSSTLQYFPASPPTHPMRPHPSGSAGLPPGGPMADFSPQQTMEMQQAMMMRGGPGGPGPQDYMGPMGQGLHPGMGMGPGGPVPSSMGMDMAGMSSGMASPMDPMMMGPGPSAMRQVTALGPGGAGPMDPAMSSMMGPGGAVPQSGYPSAGPPTGYMPNGQSMMMGQGPMAGPGGPSAMGAMPMSHSGMARMPSGPQMRMGGMAGPASSGYGAGYQQFQQQLYTQGRSRQMGPMMGPGQPYGMGMMPPNMPGPS